MQSFAINLYIIWASKTEKKVAVFLKQTWRYGFRAVYSLLEWTKRNCESHRTQRAIISGLISLMRNSVYVCSCLWVSYRFFVISSLSTISVSSRQTKLLLQLYANKHGEVAFDQKKGFDKSVNHWLRIPLSRLSRNIQQFNCKTRWLEQ